MVDIEEERWGKMPITIPMLLGLGLILNAVGKLLKGLKQGSQRIRLFFKRLIYKDHFGTRDNGLKRKRPA